MRGVLVLLIHLGQTDGRVDAYGSRQPGIARSTSVDPWIRARILGQVTTYRRLRIGRDAHLDQSEAYDMS